MNKIALFIILAISGAAYSTPLSALADSMRLKQTQISYLECNQQDTLIDITHLDTSISATRAQINMVDSNVYMHFYNGPNKVHSFLTVSDRDSIYYTWEIDSADYYKTHLETLKILVKDPIQKEQMSHNRLAVEQMEKTGQIDYDILIEGMAHMRPPDGYPVLINETYPRIPRMWDSLGSREWFKVLPSGLTQQLIEKIDSHTKIPSTAPSTETISLKIVNYMNKFLYECTITSVNNDSTLTYYIDRNYFVVLSYIKKTPQYYHHIAIADLRCTLLIPYFPDEVILQSRFGSMKGVQYLSNKENRQGIPALEIVDLKGRIVHNSAQIRRSGLQNPCDLVKMSGVYIVKKTYRDHSTVAVDPLIVK